MLLRVIIFVCLISKASAFFERHARLSNDTAAQSRRFIVECGKGQDADTLGEIIRDRLGGQVLRAFSTSVFCGVSVEALHVNLDSFLALGVVSNVWHSKQLELAPISPEMPTSQGANVSNYTIHHMTNVDRLHREGIFGKGVRVAVIDTGIDYNHSALGGGFGPGFKVAGGYDLVGDAWSPGRKLKKKPKDDPMDIFGHGTHVAGIIAGKTDRWTGVAPEATLLGYKVFGSGGGTDEDTLIEAFLMAHEEGADIITASIGGPGGWASGAWATVASRVVDDGTVVTISAGNSGGVGSFFGSSGSSGKYVLAVASIDADTLPGLAFEAALTKGNITETFGYMPGQRPFPPSISRYPIWSVTFNLTDESAGCTRLSGTQNLSNVVVISPTGGGCFLPDRLKLLMDRGARQVLFYNDTQIILPRFVQEGMVLGAIDYDTAKILVHAQQREVDVRLTFSRENSMRYVGVSDRSGGVASYFTSLATLFDLQIKPDIAAPGGNIFSTYLNNTFQILSGTSMSCPYVAGVAALYIGKYGGRREHGRGFAKALAMRIMSSGRPVKWSDGVTPTDYGEWASVMQVGTGLIDAYKVLTYNTTLSWAKFGLNDTDHHQARHRVAITNEGPKRTRYRFSAQVAGGIEAIDPDINPSLLQVGPIPLPPVFFRPSTMKPDIVFPEDLWVEPGATKNAEFLIDYPAGLDEKKLPVYSGNILVSSTNSEQLSIPYLGVAASIQETFRNPFYPRFPVATSTNDMTSIREKPFFSFNLSTDSQDFLQVDCAFRWGVSHLRWDIFEPGWSEKDWKYPPKPGQNGFIGAATSWTGAGSFFKFDPERDDEEDVITFPVHDTTRSLVYSYWWLGGLTDGTKIKPGNYTMRFAALAPSGDPKKSADWSVFEVPEIQVIGPRK